MTQIESEVIMPTIVKINGHLFQADKILHVEQVRHDCYVCVDGCDDEITVDNCNLDQFLDAWRQAVRFGA